MSSSSWACSQVPSGFLLTDVLLALHKRMGSKLLQCTEEDDTLDVVASREASRLKRLIQALRYLWRSSILATYSGVILHQISIFFHGYTKTPIKF